MVVQDFRDLLAARPFKPFRVVMASGQSYEVKHPEMAFVTKTDLVIGIDVQEDDVPARFRVCSLLHVTAIEPIEPASKGPQ
jgi:hypothetical protein